MRQFGKKAKISVAVLLLTLACMLLAACGGSLAEEDVTAAVSIEEIASEIIEDGSAAFEDSETENPQAGTDDSAYADSDESSVDISENSDIKSADETAQEGEDVSLEETDAEEVPAREDAVIEDSVYLDEHGVYDSKDEVAEYLFVYGTLPENYITKKEARELGWSGGSVEVYAPGMCIGGDHFGNYEEVLPVGEGISYTECDIDTLGASGRGAKRLVFDNAGNIYYTEDHYETFEQLYDKDGKVE